MERYEFQDGSSSKFWEVEVEGEKLTVRFGRIGTNGQTKEKTFASAAAATKEKDTLVKEKTGKGYVAAGASSASASPVAAKPKKAAPEKDVAVTPDTVPTGEPPVAKAPPPLSGVSLLSRPALASRSRPAPARDPKECLAALAHALAQPRAPKPNGEAVSPWPQELRNHPLRSDMNAEEIVQWGKTFLDNGLLPYFRTSRSAQVAETRTLCENFAFWTVATQGAAAALAVADALRDHSEKNSNYRNTVWSDLILAAFRAALSSAPEKDYEAAVEAARALRDKDDWARDAFLAFVLADDRPNSDDLTPLSVLEDAAAAGFDASASPTLVPLVAEAPATRTKPWRVKRNYYLYFSYFDLLADEIAATVIAAARRNGDSALPTL